MKLKNNVFKYLVILLLLQFFLHGSTNQQKSWIPTWLSNNRFAQFLRNYFYQTRTSESKEKQFAKAIKQSIASGKPLDLKDFFKEKEEQSNNILTDPEESARRFYEAVKNNGILTKLPEGHTKKFLFGASSSSYQYEGGLDEHNANAIFYKEKGLPPAGIAIDFWNRYKADIKQMKEELGINCFRLSIAWERMQPEKNKWNQEAISTYKDIIKSLKANKIEPLVVFHHYTVPQWFLEEGGFEKKQNISYFVVFAQKIYEALYEDVSYWSTFNAIEGYAFKGYSTGDGPPGKKSLWLTQKVMYNMLDAHGKVYDAIKYTYKNKRAINQTIPEPFIGLQKNIVPFDPFDTSQFCEKIPTMSRQWEMPLKKIKSQFVCSFATILNDTIYFRLLRVKYAKKLDWIGLNYHSNMIMKGAQRVIEEDEYRKTKNINYRDYPEGMYRALKIVYENVAKPMDIPIIITENGIATDNDQAGNAKRKRFARRTLYIIRKLIEQGYPIIGYLPWASHDNYEWPSKNNPSQPTDQPDPYDRPYGFFHVNFDKQSPAYLQRTLKSGAEYYRDFIKQYFKLTAPKLNNEESK